MKVKASSNFWRVPSQTNLHLRTSMSGLKTSAKAERAREFSPSAPITRSWLSMKGLGSSISVSKLSSMPRSRARRCSSRSSRLRPMPQKPCPVETVRTPLWMTAMSSQ